MGEMGWIGTAIPEAHGGAGFGYLELCVIAEELGRSLAPTPFASTIYLAAEALLLAGSEAQKKRWLPRSPRERHRLLRPRRGPARGDPAPHHARDGGRLTGTKLPVAGRRRGGLRRASSRDADGARACPLPRRPQRTRRHAHPADDGGPHALARPHRLRRAPAEPLGAPAPAGRSWSVCSTARPCSSPSSSSAARRPRSTWRASTRSAASPSAGRSRRSRPSSTSWPTCTWRVELARSNAYYGAWALSTDAPELPVAAATARVAATEAYYHGAKENIQVHGGMGFTWEFDCHLHYRRAKLTGLMLGSARRWKDLLITRLRGGRRAEETHGLRRHPEEAEFRKEVRQWLGANAEPKSGAFETWQSRYPGRDGYEARARQGVPGQEGRRGIRGPALAGRMGWPCPPPIYQVIYSQEEARYLVARGYFEIGLGMCMPTLFAFGTEAQKRRYAPAALRGQEVWCQLFSEPGRGLRPRRSPHRAQRDGDEWVINGQKIWTSGAHWADWAILVARSDPKTAKHKGLTFFFLSMKSPGIETRRIKQISGRLALQRGLLHRRAHPRQPAARAPSARAGAWPSPLS